MASRKEQKEQARARRLEEEARAKAQTERKRRLTLVGVAVAALAVAAVVVAVVVTSGAKSPPAAGHVAPLSTLGSLKRPPPAGPSGPEGVPIPAAPELVSANGPPGTAIDGIDCETSEQTLFHIHAHLTLFVSGTPRQLPFGIGIAGARAQPAAGGEFVSSGSCFYWLHTHAADGIIHIESPVQRTFTLGNFFDVWGEKLGPSELGPVRGPVTAFYNGKVFRGNPRAVPLTRHAEIQLEIGRPLIAPETIAFPAGL